MSKTMPDLNNFLTASKPLQRSPQNGFFSENDQKVPFKRAALDQHFNLSDHLPTFRALIKQPKVGVLMAKTTNPKQGLMYNSPPPPNGRIYPHRKIN